MTPIVVGIDLGTTRSLVSIAPLGGKPSILPLGRGKASLPSVLFFPTTDRWIYGDDAAEAALLEPSEGAWLFKRRMGDPTWFLEIHEERYTAQDLSALLLTAIRQEIERLYPGPIEGAVLTIPAYSFEAARRDAIEAARRAGWNVLALLNEPTAAALAYTSLLFADESGPSSSTLSSARTSALSSARTSALSSARTSALSSARTSALSSALSSTPREQTPLSQASGPLEKGLVYDLGGGTLDITIVEFQGSDIRVLASIGDAALGGADWDDALAWRIAADFRRRFGWDPLDEPHAFELLRRACQTSREVLSSLHETTLRLDLDGCLLETTVTRDFLEASCLDLLQRSSALVTEALREAGCQASEIQRLLLAGGGSRMPMIQNELQRLLKQPFATSIDPESAVALGAGWRALDLIQRPPGQRRSEEDRFLPGARVQEISPHPLGFLLLRQGKPTNRLLFPRKTPLPAAITDHGFTTSFDGQEAIEIFLMQSEETHPDPTELFEAWRISAIPPRPAGQTLLSLTFRYEESGLIEIAAVDRLTQTALPCERLPLGQDLQRRLSPPPRDILLALDASASMQGRPLLEAKLAVQGFLQTLHTEQARLGLLSFGDPGVHLRVPLQQDILLLKAYLAQIQASSTTPLAEALDAASLAFESPRPDGAFAEKILLLLTDGIPDSPEEAALAAEALRKAGIRILVVGLGSATDPAYLADKIASSPSDLRNLYDPIELSSLFLSLASELSGGSGALAKWRPSPQAEQAKQAEQAEPIVQNETTP